MLVEAALGNASMYTDMVNYKFNSFSSLTPILNG
jgi:hypothetical protein